MSKYYRTVIQIEILSDEPYNVQKSLTDIAYDIDEGDCSGMATEVVVNEEKTADEMAALLEAQGSDPAFLVDEYRNDFGDDEDEHNHSASQD